MSLDAVDRLLQIERLLDAGQNDEAHHLMAQYAVTVPQGLREKVRKLKEFLDNHDNQASVALKLLAAGKKREAKKAIQDMRLILAAIDEEVREIMTDVEVKRGFRLLVGGKK